MARHSAAFLVRRGNFSVAHARMRSNHASTAKLEGNRKMPGKKNIKTQMLDAISTMS